MGIVQEIFKNGTLNYMSNVIQKARVSINDRWVEFPIHKTIIRDNVIWKLIYIEEEEGYAKDAYLLGANDEVLAIKNFTISKEEDGLALVFKFTLNIEEG